MSPEAALLAILFLLAGAFVDYTFNLRGIGYVVAGLIGAMIWITDRANRGGRA